jgi:transposase
MEKKHIIKLSGDERTRLKGLVRKGEAAAQAISRAQILLKSDEGWTDKTIGEAVGITAQTVYNTRKRYCADGLEAVLDAHGGRIVGTVAKTLDGAAEAHLVAMACGQPPEGHARWTLRLLAGQMVKLEHVDGVSYETIRRTLKKMNLSLG